MIYLTSLTFASPNPPNRWTSEKQRKRAMGDDLDKKKGWEVTDDASGLVGGVIVAVAVAVAAVVLAAAAAADLANARSMQLGLFHPAGAGEALAKVLKGCHS